MDEVVYGSLSELVTTVAAAVGSAVLTVAGLFVEWAGVQNLVTGHAGAGLWEAWIGLLVLYAGLYLLGYRTVWRRVRGRRRAA
jgi:divalent metal cation (Fe/Co/Zn/Cd) transporter